jgi:hypothetical protein
MDHLVPAVQNRSNYQKYVHSNAITDYKEFPYRSHLIIGQEGWQEIAEYALSWAKSHTQTEPNTRLPVLP